MVLFRLVEVKIFSVRQDELPFRFFVAPKHLSRPLEIYLARGFEFTVKRFYLGFLAKVRNEVDSGVVIFLEAVDDLIATSVLRGGAFSACDCDRKSEN